MKTALLESIGLDRRTVAQMTAPALTIAPPDQRDNMIADLRAKNRNLARRNQTLQNRINAARTATPTDTGPLNQLAYAVPLIEAAICYLRANGNHDGNIYSHAHITGKTRGCESVSSTRRAMAWAIHTTIMEHATAAPSVIDEWIGVQFGGRDRTTISYAVIRHEALHHDDTERQWARTLLNHLRDQSITQSADYQI